MASVNKVILVGNVGQDPIIRTTANGGSVANLSLATTDKYNDKQGNKVDKTEWHNLVAFGKSAEIIGQYVKKGSSLYIEGKLQTSSWEDKNGGGKKYKTEILIATFQFLGDKNSNNQGSSSRQSTAPSSTAPTQNAPAQGLDEDLPF